MRNFNFRSHPVLDALYIEFRSTTDYIHSIRRVKDVNNRRVEPYEPSMFIFSFFTFNTLYNIYWKTTLNHGCTKTHRNISRTETERINDYLSFIWESNREDEITRIFTSTITHVIKQYLSEKGQSINALGIGEWIDTNMVDFIYSTNKSKRNVFNEVEIKDFREYILKSFNGQKLDLAEVKHIVHIIYLVRCNLFHGAKDPEFFEENHQMERFAIYAAILTAINQLLFHTLDKRLPRRAH